MTIMKRLTGVVRLLVVVVVLAAACSSGEPDRTSLAYDDIATGTVHRYVIPLGTAERIKQGELVEVMPSRLEIKVGDAVEIVNEDDQPHNVGPFYVRVDETVHQVFPSVAEFTDVCSVSSSGTFTIDVT